MTKDIAAIFREVTRTANRMGSCDPEWLTHAKVPEFKTVEAGTEGPELVLLHGLLGAVSNWDALLPELARFSRPRALHFPILTAHRSEVKVKSLAAFTEFFLRMRGMSPVPLCGNSLGGHVALRLCLASPELVDCLILSGTSGLYEHTVDALPVRPDATFVREHMQRVFFNQRHVTDTAVQEIAEIVSDRMRVLNLIHAARSAKKDNLQHLLGQIKVPTLLLWGENDTVTTMAVAETFQKLLPNATLVTIKNCGHAPMIEYPEWFASEVQKFLQTHSRRYNQAKG